MRPFVLFLVVLLSAASAATAQAPPNLPVSLEGSNPAGRATIPRAQAPPNLPGSLERIREGLTNPRRPSMLDTFDARPHFRVEVEEKRPSFVEMFDPESVKGGPVPRGGLYGYEQQRRLNPNSSPVFGVDVLPLFRDLANAIRSAGRGGSEADAREEVARAMAEFCGAQPNGGAGVVGCDKGK